MHHMSTTFLLVARDLVLGVLLLLFNLEIPLDLLASVLILLPPRRGGSYFILKKYFEIPCEYPHLGPHLPLG